MECPRDLMPPFIESQIPIAFFVSVNNGILSNFEVLKLQIVCAARDTTQFRAF